MGKGYDGVLAARVRMLFGVGAVAGMTDGQLLDRFLDDQGPSGEAAFGAIVERHGPMVFGVCRRILQDSGEAEDAFQATFLVLARRAHSIRSRETLGAWLLGVARKVASRARNDAIRRRTLERQAAEAFSREAPSGLASFDEVEVLLREVDRLPDRLREPVVLFYLQGQSYERAAQILRTTEGTIRGRLARARDRLRARLSGQGLSVGLLAPLTRPRAIIEAVPLRLINPTVRAAVRIASGESTSGIVSTSIATLMEGALKPMVFAKWKSIGGVALLSGIIALGAGVHVQARQKPENRAAPETTKTPTQGEPKGESAVLANLVGGRVVRSVEVTKDCMILSYIPDWAFGNVDNIGIANNDGGVRTLVDWPDVPPPEAKSADLKFYLAFYSRKTDSKPKPGTIGAFELSGQWPERTSWKPRPSYADDPIASTKFEPGESWKLFDITSFIKPHEGRSGHGLMLKFLNEDRPGEGDWSGYQFVSREGEKEWAKRRPMLLVVQPSKK